MPKKAPTEQTPELLAQLYRDLTDDMIRRVTSYADKVSAKLHSIEGVADPGYARALAGDAIHDTIEGIRTWDPSRRRLYSHLCGVVQSRAWAATKQAQRRRHVAFHEPDAGDDGSSGVSMVETEMSLRRDDERARPEGAVGLAQLQARTCADLRRLAADDAQLLDLFGCYDAGCYSQPEVMERLGWSEPTYVNVRRRLNRLRRRLPDELRETVLAVLTRAPMPGRLEVQR